MGLLRRHRRAVSPVVTTVFLFGVILGAMAVSLGIIYPAVQELNDQIKLETSASSLSNLDASIQNLILNGVDSEISTEIDVGVGGALNYNNQTLSTVTVFDGSIASSLQFTLRHYRLQIQQSIGSDVLQEGTHQYFNAEGKQGYLYLNSSNRRVLGWSIINQSRQLNTDDIFTSLSYRYITTSSSFFNSSELTQRATIQIQAVNFTLAPGSNDRATGSTLPLKLNFLGSSIITTDYVNFNDDARVVAITTFPEAASPSTERPIQLLSPISSAVSFQIRMQFVFHEVQIEI